MNARLAGLNSLALIACILSTVRLLAADSVESGSLKNITVAGAEIKSPLWQTAIKRTKESGNYVAGCVQTEMSVFDGDEKLLGTVSEVERMERDGGKPRWKSGSKKQTGSPGMTIKADFGLQSDPASALEGYDEWHLQEKGELEGTAIEVWEGITKANPQNKVIAYIDVESGFPRKADFVFPFSTPVGSHLVNMTLTYAFSADGVWLPSSSVCDQKGRFLFIKRHIRMVKTYTEWEATTP